MKYYLKENGSTGEQSLKEYTFEELKAYFEPNKDELPKYWEKWNDVQCILELENYLRWEYDGMAVPYSFESVKNLKWCVVDSMVTKRGIENLVVFENKDTALRFAENEWDKLSDIDKRDRDYYVVGLCNVEKDDKGEWMYFEDENGNVDADIYDVAKKYK